MNVFFSFLHIISETFLSFFLLFLRNESDYCINIIYIIVLISYLLEKLLMNFEFLKIKS